MLDSGLAAFLSLSVGAVLTLMVYSYLWRDNLAWRLAAHLLVGLTAGLAVTMALRQALWPRLAAPLVADPLGRWPLVVPLVLVALLLARGRAGWLRALPLAYLAGVGAALTAVGGWAAVFWPQVAVGLRDAAGSVLTSEVGLNNLFITVGTLLVLLSFAYGVGLQGRAARAWAGLTLAGRWVLLSGLGVVLAGVVVSRLTLLAGRLDYLLFEWLGLLK